MGGADIPRLIEDKNYDGLLKASANKDLDVRKKAVEAFDSLGEGARGCLIANLVSAAVLKELGWASWFVISRSEVRSPIGSGRKAGARR